jgi:hypothetical protein
VQDDDPQSPDDWDALGTLYKLRHGAMRDYTFGTDAPDWAEEIAYRREEPAGLLVRYARMVEGLTVVPVQFADYGSGGARMYALADDDTARVDGYLATDAKRCEELGVPLEDAAKQLRGEVRTWDAYVEGRVIGYVVKDANGSEVDSCWGFYPDDDGDYEYVRAEARDAAETEQAERQRAAVQGVPTR